MPSLISVTFVFSRHGLESVFLSVEWFLLYEVGAMVAQ